MPELLSYAETQKLLDDLPREHQKLVSDLIPGMISVGGVQRVLQALLAERVSIRDLPTILEGVHEACAGQPRALAGIIAIVRVRLARQLCESHANADGIVPLVALSPEWETAFAESLTGSGDDRQLAMEPTRLSDFMRRFREAFDANAAESPVLLTSATLRTPVRAVVERIRPATPVLSQTEIHPRARIRTVGTI
jgi:flagellar biosynthesis protein FlhA